MEEFMGIIVIIVLLSILTWMLRRMLGQNVHPLWLLGWLVKKLRAALASTLHWLAKQISG